MSLCNLMTDVANTYTIDAAGKRIGRVASEAARVLMGKHLPTYQPNLAGDVTVSITNASQLEITEAKRDQKTYTRYSGYPGGLKTETLEQVIDKKGAGEAIRRAVYGMLPGNKLRSPRMKRLQISE